MKVTEKSPLEETRLDTPRLEAFIQIVEDWGHRWSVGSHAIFRGPTDFNWILVAKLFRRPDAKPQNTLGDDPHDVERQLLKETLPKKVAPKLESKLLGDFSRYLYSYRPDLVCTVAEEERSNTRSMQEWRQLDRAQHYGLPTRFLDFTTNMLAALFFAVEESVALRKTMGGEWREQDSAVWCVDVPNRRKVWQVWKKNNDDIWLPPLDFAKEGSDPPIDKFVDNAFIPEHFDERIPAQGSVFISEARGKKNDWTLHTRLRDKTRAVLRESDDEPLEEKETRTRRIRIPATARETLREQLDKVGINRANLFPDLASVASYLTWSIYQRKRA